MNKFTSIVVLLAVSLLLVGCGKQSSLNDVVGPVEENPVVKTDNQQQPTPQENSQQDQEEPVDESQKEFVPEDFYDEEIDDLLLLFDGLVEG